MRKQAVFQPGYSLVNYQKALEKMLIRSIGNTLIISVSALAIILVIAILIACLVVRRSKEYMAKVNGWMACAGPAVTRRSPSRGRLG